MKAPENAPTPKIKYDGELAISTGKSRKEIAWKNKTVKWSSLVEKLKQTTRTPETVAEYKKLTKTEKDNLKDVGGFVGGSLKNGRRKAENVANRTLITLDLDEVDTTVNDLWETIVMLYDFNVLLYSTHTHTKESPRLRMVIPLASPVLGEEYQAISRKLAEDLGIDQFDDTTYEPHRLMYWPSTPSDGEYVFKLQDEKWLDPKTVLARYPDWRDTSYWPESSRQNVRLRTQLEKQEDPLTKKGIIGAFCRTYSIQEAIDVFLPDVYTQASGEDRYSYAKGSTVGGVVIYDDKFSFSHHGTDPASGQLCNAFDLVRIHKFGHRDDEAKADTPATRLPSFVAMSTLASNDIRVKALIGKEHIEEFLKDFDLDIDAEEIDTSWTVKLKTDTKGKYLSTIENALIVLENDQLLKGKIAYNSFANRAIVKAKMPWGSDSEKVRDWSDNDDAGLRYYMESAYGINGISKIADATAIAFENAGYNPVKDYLQSLKWDGVKRVDYLLSDYLGAEDTLYTKAVIRKHLVAAVARIFKPGIKYDYMLVLSGAQGIGKSTMIRLLAKEWFNDSLVVVNSKEAYELLQGSWLIEMSELTATRKADIESTKQFLSKVEDVYRVAYGRRTSRFPRQCIFWGTTNDREFLRDRTGNRRFWPVDCGIEEPIKSVFEDLPEEVDQIWAEAVSLFKCGEKLYLNRKEEEEAQRQQDEHSEESVKAGQIMAYLEVLLPDDWYDLSLSERRDFLNGLDVSGHTGTMERTKISVAEVWCECFNGEMKQLTPIVSREINDILRSLKDWKRHNNHLRFGAAYGRQRCYVRHQS